MFLHWGKKAYSKAALTSWNLKRDKNYLYVNYLVTYYLKYSVPLTQRLQIWRWKYSWTKPLNMLKLWMIAIKYTAIHTGTLKSDLPEQNHFIFISFCSILWKPNQKRIIKIESSCAYLFIVNVQIIILVFSFLKIIQKDQFANDSAPDGF